MNQTLRMALLLAVVVYFLLLLYLLKKRTLNIKYSLLWLFSGILMLLLAVCPQILSWFARVVGISAPVNALFALVLFCVLCIVMSLTAIVSKLNERVKRLTQTCALLEKRLRDREEIKTEK